MKKHLLLDLDKTLIYSTIERINNNPIVNILPTIINVEGHNLYLYIRTGLHTFLHELSKHFQLSIFTASKKEYADVVIDVIDPNNLVTNRFYRNNCDFNDITYIKDVAKFGSLEHTFIIDDQAGYIIINPNNGIVIAEFIGYHDNELLKLLPYLKLLSTVDDIQSYLDVNTNWIQSYQKLINAKQLCRSERNKKLYTK